MKFLVQVLCLVLFLLNSPTTTLSSTVCSPLDSVALLQFKNETTSSFPCGSLYCDEPRAKTESWKEGTNCCTWDGVTCDNVSNHAHVIGLDLSCSCFFVEFPSNSSLFSLLRLESLNLAYNDFSESEVPSDVGRLVSLTYLNLSASYFSKQVPSEISHLNKLLTLDLSYNHLRIEDHVLKAMVENLTVVSQLFLDWMNMPSVDPSIFMNLSSSLTHLSLHGSGNSDVSTPLSGKFPEAVFRLPNLIFLDLMDNFDLIPQLPKSNWTGPLETLKLLLTSYRDEFPASIVNLSSLTHLNMRYCSCLGSLPRELGNLNKLVYLDLSYNQINGNIPSSFVNLTQLQYLDFSNNQLSGPLTEFPYAPLEYIDMGNNRLQGPIPSSISNLPNLTLLDLSSNSLSSVVDLQLFSELKRLEFLNLSHSNLSLVFDANLSYSFSAVSTLGLSSCNISQIPKIARDSAISLDLDLSNNRIQEIPESVWDMGDFSLNLNWNFLQSFEQIKFLEHLQSSHSLDSFSISNNGLTGEIPSTICSITGLGSLDLSFNNLTGTIPRCLSHLSYLDLSYNDLTGIIPPNLSRLSFLNLQMNKFRGEIRFASADCGLRYLNLNGNQFEGGIPEAIANCINLEVIDFGNNNLYGTFPHWFGNLDRLQVLVLRSNRLYGSLSETNCSLSELRILDLSHNRFSGPLLAVLLTNLKIMMNVSQDEDFFEFQEHDGGTIPTPQSIYYEFSVGLIVKGLDMEFARILIQLMIINLSNNRFEGEIPEVIGKLRSLKGLDLSHNKFSGHIPGSIGNLTNLEWLDLSSNNLGGQIPGELTGIPWLAVLNLSYNHLVGPIPKGKQFDTFEKSSYEGNAGLCGFPVSKSCYDVPGNHQPTPISEFEEKDSELWEFGWRIVVLGFGSGLAFGLFVGFLVFQTGKPKWFVNLAEDMQFLLVTRKGKKAPRHVPRRN